MMYRLHACQLVNLVWDHTRLYDVFVEKVTLSRLYNLHWGSELSDFSPDMHLVPSR